MYIQSLKEDQIILYKMQIDFHPGMAAVVFYIHIYLVKKKLATENTTDFPQMVVNCKGNGTPYFWEIQVGEIL